MCQLYYYRLTREAGGQTRYACTEEGDERLVHKVQVIIKKENIDSKFGLFAASFSNDAIESKVSLVDLFKRGYMTDKLPNKVL
jgi:hypothetical protein